MVAACKGTYSAYETTLFRLSRRAVACEWALARNQERKNEDLQHDSIRNNHVLLLCFGFPARGESIIIYVDENFDFVTWEEPGSTSLNAGVVLSNGLILAGEWTGVVFREGTPESHTPLGEVSNVYSIFFLNSDNDTVYVLGGIGVNSNGIAGKVNVMRVYGDYMYIGGDFTYAQQASQTLVQSPNCVRWDLTSPGWDPLYSSTYGGLSDEVLTIEIMGPYHNDPGSVYVGGRFTDVSGYSGANYLAEWEDPNPSWIPVETGIMDPVVSISFTSSYPYYSYTTE